MTPDQIEQVFGRGRLKMVTGEHVEVFREAMAQGERRRYTKRFLATSEGDFGPWTEREWRILARLIGHGIRCVPDVVQFDGGAMGGARLVQTYDAGITVDQWGTLLPVERNGETHGHVFEDCAHWWALAHHCLAALDEIHALGLVHLDIKGDNICIPYGPADFDPQGPARRLRPEFGRLALIDFAFSLVSRESLAMPLPIGWQKNYDYQSPRLLRALDAGRHGDLEPTRELDWRCDLYSLAAMLKHYLPDEAHAYGRAGAAGWSTRRYDEARTLILRLRESHDRDLPHWRPHRQFMDYTASRLDAPDLAASLVESWALAHDEAAAGGATSMTPITPITPMTRIAPPVRSLEQIRTDVALRAMPPTAITTVIRSGRARPREVATQPPRAPMPRAPRRALSASIALMALATIAAPSFIGDAGSPVGDLAPAGSGDWRSALAPPTHEVAAPPTSPGPTTIASSTEPSADTSAGDPPDSAQPGGMSSATPVPSAPAASPHEPIEAPGAPNAAAAIAPPTTIASPPKMAHARPKSSGGASVAAGSKRSSVALARPPSAAARATADAVRRATLPGVEHARGSASPRVDLAATATPPARVSVGTPSTVATAEAIRAGVDGRASAPPATVIATSEVALQSAGTDLPRSKAATTPPSSRDGEASASESSPGRGEASPPRSVPPSKPRDDWRSRLAGLFGVFRDRNGAPAPVEDRNGQAAAARQATSRMLAQAATDALARAAVVPAVAVPVAQSPAPPVLVPAPIANESAVQAPPSVRSISANEVESRPAATGAFDADARTRPPMPPGMAYLPAPVPPTPTRVVASQQESQDLVSRASRLLVETIPRVAAQAEPEMSRVLSLAAVANRPAQSRQIAEAADGPWPSESAWIPVAETMPAYARRLHNEARRASASGTDIAAAVNIELEAFGANPRDPDIAGYLAALHLRMTPARPETARQLALHAIVLSGSRRSTRYSEWSTFAVASALTGRDADAARAFLAEAALTSNVERSCQVALRAYASYGERLRTPVLTLLQRVNAQGRAYDAPSCTWPAYWNAAARAGAAF